MVSGDEIIEDGGDHRHPQEEVPQHAWPSQAVRVLLGPEIFQAGDETALLPLNAGAGCALSSYLPHGGPDKVRSSFPIRGCGEGCGERGPAMDTDDWPELPAWTEKRTEFGMFDPEGVLFRGGAHMPLFGFLGNRPRRSGAAILRLSESQEPL